LKEGKPQGAVIRRKRPLGAEEGIEGTLGAALKKIK